MGLGRIDRVCFDLAQIGGRVIPVVRCALLQGGRVGWETPAYGVLKGEAQAESIWLIIDRDMF